MSEDGLHSTEVKNIQAEQGWTDATLLAVLLDFCDQNPFVGKLVVERMEEIANDENNGTIEQTV
jgi:hypothetical protein